MFQEFLQLLSSLKYAQPPSAHYYRVLLCPTFHKHCVLTLSCADMPAITLLVVGAEWAMADDAEPHSHVSPTMPIRERVSMYSTHAVLSPEHAAEALSWAAALDVDGLVDVEREQARDGMGVEGIIVRDGFMHTFDTVSPSLEAQPNHQFLVDMIDLAWPAFQDPIARLTLQHVRAYVR